MTQENRLKHISSEKVQTHFIKAMLDITHFAPKEYCYSATTNHWVDIEYFEDNLERQLYKLVFLLHPLLSILEAVRAEFKSPVVITSGIRDLEVWYSLYGFGYPISKTTDHSYGFSYNPFGVGAIDHFVVGVNIEDVYKYEKSRFGYLVGQLILYKKSRFIHMSNPRNLVYSNKFIHYNYKTHEKFIEWDK